MRSRRLFSERRYTRIGTAAPWLCAAVFLSACSPPGPEPLVFDEDTPGIGPGGLDDSIDPLVLGHRLLDGGNAELALKAYYRAGNKYGLTPEILTAIGSANLQLGRLGQAEKILRLAIREDERSISAWNNLGVTLNARNNLPEAREAFRVAFQLDSGETPQIAENLRRVEAKMQDLEVDPVDDSDFRLVRKGNGRYLLVGNEQ